MICDIVVDVSAVGQYHPRSTGIVQFKGVSGLRELYERSLSENSRESNFWIFFHARCAISNSVLITRRSIADTANYLN